MALLYNNRKIFLKSSSRLIREVRPELARYQASVVVTAVSTEAQHDGEIIVFLAVIGYEKSQLIREHVKAFLLRQHTNGYQVRKETQVYT